MQEYLSLHYIEKVNKPELVPVTFKTNKFFFRMGTLYFDLEYLQVTSKLSYIYKDL